MSEDTTKAEEYAAARKQKAKEFRRALYLKIKNSPSTLALKAKQKEMRKAARQKAKDAGKAQRKERKHNEINERIAARKERDAELMNAVLPATEIAQEPAPRPKLQVIAGGKSDFQ